MTIKSRQRKFGIGQAKDIFQGKQNLMIGRATIQQPMRILCELDSLDMNLVLQEDISMHIDFFETAIGEFEAGYRKWRSRIERIDFKQRCKKLMGHEIYGPFCK